MPPHDTTTSRVPALRIAWPLALLAALALAARPAVAESIAKARGQYDAGRTAAAAAELSKWLFAGDVDAEQLLRAVELARKLQDLDVLGLIRSAGEGLEEQGAADQKLHLALGFVYLGLAEEHLRRRTGGSSVSLYFADALARAAKVPPTAALGAAGVRLAAETHYAKGDATAALRTIQEGLRDLAGKPTARLHAFHALLRYERGVAGGTQSDGRPTPPAQAELEQALAACRAAIDAGTLAGAELRAVHLRHAWANHRTGRYDAAVESYRAAYAPGTRQGTLAIRGLQSLLSRDADRLTGELKKLVAAHPSDGAPASALLQLHLTAGRHGDALLLAQARLESSPDDPAALFDVGRVLSAAGQHANAKRYYVEVLRRDGSHLQASFRIEELARSHLASEPARTLALYEELLQLRPHSPYIRNNYGFILRDLVTPHTTVERGGIQRLKPQASAAVRAQLERCIAVYAQAAALIDPKDDGTRDEMEAWNLAGIVNDYGLMLHYFIDVQDAVLAERQYLRALRMTDYGFKDTYSPNLHRLYRYVLPDRAWRWYRIAREAKDAILREARDANGRLVLVPDEQKREAARRDMTAARARILQILKLDADEDGLPWPPGKETGNDR